MELSALSRTTPRPEPYEGVPPVCRHFACPADGETPVERDAKLLTCHIVQEMLAGLFEDHGITHPTEPYRMVTGMDDFDVVCGAIVRMLPAAEYMEGSVQPVILAPEGSSLSCATPVGANFSCSSAAANSDPARVHIGPGLCQLGMFVGPDKVPYVGYVRDPVGTPPHRVCQPVDKDSFAASAIAEGGLQVFELQGTYEREPTNSVQTHEPAKASRKRRLVFARTGDETADNISALAVLSSVTYTAMVLTMLAYQKPMQLVIDAALASVGARWNMSGRPITKVDVGVGCLRDHKVLGFAGLLRQDKAVGVSDAVSGSDFVLSVHCGGKALHKEKRKPGAERDPGIRALALLLEKLFGVEGGEPVDSAAELRKYADAVDRDKPASMLFVDESKTEEYVDTLLKSSVIVHLASNPRKLEALHDLFALDGAEVPYSGGERVYAFQLPRVFDASGQRLPLHLLLLANFANQPYGSMEWALTASMGPLRSGAVRDGGKVPSVMPSLLVGAQVYSDLFSLVRFFSLSRGGDRAPNDVRSAATVQISSAVDACIRTLSESGDATEADLMAALQRAYDIKRRACGLTTPLALPSSEQGHTLDEIEGEVVRARDAQDARDAIACCEGDGDGDNGDGNGDDDASVTGVPASSPPVVEVDGEGDSDATEVLDAAPSVQKRKASGGKARHKRARRALAE